MSIYTSVCVYVCVWATLREHTQPVCVCVYWVVEQMEKLRTRVKRLNYFL